MIKVIDLEMGSLPRIIQVAQYNHKASLKWKREAGESESNSLNYMWKHENVAQVAGWRKGP